MTFKALLVCVLIVVGQAAQAFDKVVIWGYKLHSHTHSYIHYGFYRGFQHLGYDTYWFDDRDDVSKFDFSNSLFITVGTADNNIPIRDDCQYILHNCDSPKYRPLYEKNKAMYMQVFTVDVYPRPVQKIAPFIYYDIKGKGVYMPWATDLLPDEIDAIKKELAAVKQEKKVYWIGSLGGGEFGNESEIAGFRKGCQETQIEFVHINPWTRPASAEESRKMITRSYLAPAIVGEWQKRQGYIPCRIFKNISYGQMGVTNSKYVSELFEGKIVYNPDTYSLFYDAQKRLKTTKLEEIYELMDIVKNKHTYLNRIQTLLNFFDLLQTTK